MVKKRLIALGGIIAAVVLAAAMCSALSEDSCAAETGSVLDAGGIAVGTWSYESGSLTVSSSTSGSLSVPKTLSGFTHASDTTSVTVTGFWSSMTDLFSAGFTSVQQYSGDTDNYNNGGFGKGTWTYSTSSKELTVAHTSSNSNMYNWATSGNYVAPWTKYGFKNEITKATITGFKTLGYFSFYGCTELRTIESASVEALSHMDILRVEGTSGNVNGGKISTISMPNLTKVGGDSYGQAPFYRMSSLTSVSFPSATFIGVNTFFKCKNLQSVTLANQSVQVKNNAFNGCDRLSSINTSGITSIDQAAFSGCIALPSSLDLAKVITLGSTSDGIGVFQGCTSITSVSMPLVQTIGRQAFHSCSGLEEATLGPTGLATIGDRAFYGCTKLRSIQIPNTLATMGAGAFENCSSLESVDISTSLGVISDRAFYGCIKLTSISIPDNIQDIKASAFEGCNKLSTLTLNSGLATIGNSAFKNCTQLTSVEIPAGVTDIGNDAFEGCSNLAGPLNIPGSVKSIGDRAFQNCGSLNAVVFNTGLETIGNSAFKSSALRGQLTLPSTLQVIKASAFQELTNISGSLAIPNSVTTIEALAFYGCSQISSLTIGSGTVTIGNHAFYRCTSIGPTLTIPSSVATVGTAAFYDCRSIVTLTFESGCAASVGYQSFQSCTGMTTLNLGDSLSSVSAYAFVNCSEISNEISLPSTLTQIGESAFNGCSKMKGTIAIPGTVERVGISAFHGCRGLTSLTISNGVKYIGASAFQGCAGLSGPLSLPDSVLEIGRNAFYECNNLQGSLNLTNVASIGSSAFNGCMRLTGTLNIPSSVTSIGEYAFARCEGFTALELDANIEVLAVGTFKNCVNIQGPVTIPDSVKAINSEAFSGCARITGITFGSSGDLESIGSNAFYGCAGIASNIVIPDGVTSIGERAFHGCSGAKGLDIGSGVRSIGSEAFRSCWSLESISVDEGNNFFRSFNNALYTYDWSTLLYYAAGSQTGSFVLSQSTSRIDSYAFEKAANLRSVALSSNVNLTIGAYAFSQSGLAGTLTIPANVISVESFAFRECINITGLVVECPGADALKSNSFFNCTGIESLTIPVSVKNSDGAFNGCTGFRSFRFTGTASGLGEYYNGKWNSTPWYISRNREISVVFEEGVMAIDPYMFQVSDQSYTGIRTVAISNTVQTVGKFAFNGCSRIDTLTIGNSVSVVGEKAFNRCTSLRVLTMPVTLEMSQQDQYSTMLTNINLTAGTTGIGVDYTEGTSSNTLWSRSTNYSLSMADGIKRIGSNSKLMVTGNITTPPSLQSIGEKAFKGSFVNTLVLNSGLKTLGDEAFASCATLARVTLPGTIETLSGDPFKDCVILSDLTLPIGFDISGKFQGCTSLQKFNFTADGGQAIDYNEITSKSTVWYVACGNKNIAVDFAPGIARIGNHMFDGCSRQSGANTYSLAGTISLPDTVVSVGKAAFRGCTGITTFTHGTNLTTIGDEAFKNCTGLGSLTMRTGTTYGKNAFAGCTGLAQLTLPISANPVGYDDTPIFEGCTGITRIVLTGTASGLAYSQAPGSNNFCERTPWYYSNGKNISLTIGEGIASIGANMFRGCTGLDGMLALPASLTSVGDSAFDGCTGLDGVLTIPATLNSIGSRAFAGCASISGITVERADASIGSSAFAGCTGMTVLSIPASFNAVGSDDAPIFSGCTGLAVLNVTGVGDCFDYRQDPGADAYYRNTPWYLSRARDLTLSISEGVTSVGDHMFRECGVKGTLSLPTSVSEAGAYSFAGCTRISGTFTVASSLSKVGAHAFEGCTGITRITVTSESAEFGEAAFKGCTGLTALTVPIRMDVVVNDSDPLFSGCTGIRTLSFTGSGIGPDYASKYERTPWYYSRGNGISLTLSDSITAIGGSMFRGCIGLTGNLSLPSGLTSIGDHAFSGCAGITGSFTVTAGMTSIGASAFSGCTGLSSVAVANRNASIGGGAFSGCTGIRTLSVPIGFNAVGFADAPIFGGCTGITALSFTGSGVAFNYTDADDTDYRKTPWHFSRNSPMTISLPEGATTIGKNMFRDCARLSGTISLPSSVTSIGAWAFAGCTGIGSVPDLSSVKTVEEHAFDGCTGMVGAFSVPIALTTVGNSAFKGCTGITALTIASVPANLGTGVFDGCTGISSLTLPVGMNAAFASAAPMFRGCTGVTSVTFTGSGAGAVYSDAEGSDNYYRNTPWYYSRSNSIRVEFPAGTTSIGAYVFSGCTGLAGTLAIPSDVGTIGDRAFAGCSQLTNLTFSGAALTSIGASAFEGCTSVGGTLTFPETVRMIGESAFRDCAGITGALTVGPNVRTVGAYAFKGCTRIPSITVSDASTAVAKGAFASCTGLRSLAFPGTSNTVVDGTDPVFGGCTGIETVRLTGSGDGQNYNAVNNSSAFYQKTPWYFSRNNTITLTIGNGITSIGSDTFRDCIGIKGQIALPSALTSIKTRAFMGCDGIEGALTIGASVAEVGSQAFQGCTRITALTISSGRTDLSQGSFSGCSGISSITLPISINTVVNSDNPAFNQCTGIRSVTLNGTEDGFVYSESVNSDYRKTPWQISGGNAIALTVSEGVLSIGAYTFKDCNFISGALSLPASVARIGAHAFEGCSRISGELRLTSVTGLGEAAFKDCTQISSLTVSVKPTSVGASAFAGCTGLRTLTVPIDMDAVVNNENPLFAGCTGLTRLSFTAGNGISYSGDQSGDRFYRKTPWYLSRGNEITVTFGSGVTSIGAYMFKECGTGTSERGIVGDVSIPETLKTIGAHAFEGCANITSVTANGITSAGEASFEGCRSMASAAMPALASASNNMFKGCTMLSSATLTACTNIGASAFEGTTSLRNVNNSDSGDAVRFPAVTRVGDRAFAGSGLTNAYIGGDGISFVLFGDYVFHECPNLETVTISGSLGLLPSNTFRSSSTPQGFRSPLRRIDAKNVQNFSAYLANNFQRLQYVDISGATSISGGDLEGMFLNCVDLQTVKLHKNPGSGAVYTLPRSAFEGCVRLSDIDLSNANLSKGREFYGCAALNSVNLANSVAVPAYSFYDCSNLTTMSAPKATSIGEYAFSRTHLSSLTALQFAAAINVGNNAFEKCLNLATVDLPAVTRIGVRAFEGCSALTAVTLNRIESTEEGLFKDCSNLVNVSMDALTSVGVLTFSGCRALTTLSLANVKAVGVKPGPLATMADWERYAVFNGCTSLRTVNMPKLETAGAFAFYGCSTLSHFNSEEYVDLSKIGYIGLGAFAKSGCVRAVVGNGTSGIIGMENYAFYDCQSLQVFESPSLQSLPLNTFSTSVLSEGSLAPMLRTVNVSRVTAFNADLHGSNSLMEVTAPLATSFSSNAFRGCAQLRTVTLMDNPSAGALVVLSPNMFRDCVNLVSVTLTNAQLGGETSDENGGGTFRDCVRLASASMPVCTKVTAYAFAGCTALESASMPKAASVGKNAFDGCRSLVDVNLPIAAEIGDHAFNGCSMMTGFNAASGTNPFIAIASIGSYAFAGCPFEGVTLGPRLTFLGDHAFSQNFRLKEVVIPNLLTKIPAYAFAGCPLENVHISSSVTSVLERAFDYTGSSAPSQASFWFNGTIGSNMLALPAFYSESPISVKMCISSDSESNLAGLLGRGAVGGSISHTVERRDSTTIFFQSEDPAATPNYINAAAIHGGKIVLPLASGNAYPFAVMTNSGKRLSVFASDADFAINKTAVSGRAVPIYPLKDKDNMLFTCMSDDSAFQREMTIETDSFGLGADLEQQTAHYGGSVTVPKFSNPLNRITEIRVVREDGTSYVLPLDTETFKAGYYFSKIVISPEEALVDVTFVSKGETRIAKLKLQSFFATPAELKYMEEPLGGFAFDGWYSAENGNGIKANPAITKISGGMVWYAHFTAKEHSVQIRGNGMEYEQTVTVYGPYKLRLIGGVLYYTDYTHASNTIIVDTSSFLGYSFDALINTELNQEVGEDDGPYTKGTILNMYMVTKKYKVTLQFEEGGAPIPADTVFEIRGWKIGDRIDYRSGDSIEGIDFSLIKDGLSMPIPLSHDYALDRMYAGSNEIAPMAGGYTITAGMFDTDGSVTVTYRMTTGIFRVVFEMGDDTNAKVNLGAQVSVGIEFRIAAVTGIYEKKGYVFSHMGIDGIDAQWKENQRVTVTNDMADSASYCVITFKAHWVSKDFTVRYDTSPHTAQIEPMVVRIGDTVSLPEVAGYVGYKLTGWRWASGGAAIEGDFVLTKEMVERYAGNGTELTLQAGWSLRTYTVNADPSAGPKYITKTVEYRGTFSLWDIGSYTQAYKKFEGWSIGSRIYGNMETVTVDDYIAAMGDANGDDIVFGFSWKDLEYQVQYNLNKGEGEIPVDNGVFIVGQTPFVMAADNGSFQREGYTFVGWKYSKDSYTVYENSSGLFDVVLARSADSNGIVTLYAVWAEKSYRIAYNLSSGRAGPNSPSNVTYGSEVSISNPTRSGYDFAGWTATGLTSGALHASGFGYSYWNGTRPTVSTMFMDLCSTDGGTVTMTANWVQASFGVSYDTNGGDGIIVGGMTEIKIGDTIAMPVLRNPYKLGYTYAGWGVDKVNAVRDGSKFTPDMVQSQTENEIVFYAIWAPITYTLKYIYTGSMGMNSLDVNYGEKVSIPVLTRPGFAFSGWTSSGMGDTANYSFDGDSWYKWPDGTRPVGDKSTVSVHFRNLSSNGGATVTLEANWVPIQYRLVYHANGGTGNAPMDSRIYTVGDSVSMKGYESLSGTNGGRTVVGWSLERNGSATDITEFTEGLAEKADYANSVNLYAVWVEGMYIVKIDLTGCTTDRIPSGWSMSADDIYQKLFEKGTKMSDVMDDWKDVKVSKEGHVFSSWSYDGGAISSDVRVVPSFEKVDMTVFYAFAAAVIGTIVAAVALSRRGR